MNDVVADRREHRPQTSMIRSGIDVDHRWLRERDNIHQQGNGQEKTKKTQCNVGNESAGQRPQHVCIALLEIVLSTGVAPRHRPLDAKHVSAAHRAQVHVDARLAEQDAHSRHIARVNGVVQRGEAALVDRRVVGTLVFWSLTIETHLRCAAALQQKSQGGRVLKTDRDTAALNRAARLRSEHERCFAVSRLNGRVGVVFQEQLERVCARVLCGRAQRRRQIGAGAQVHRRAALQQQLDHFAMSTTSRDPQRRALAATLERRAVDGHVVVQRRLHAAHVAIARGHHQIAGCNVARLAIRHHYQFVLDVIDTRQPESKMSQSRLTASSLKLRESVDGIQELQERFEAVRETIVNAESELAAERDAFYREMTERKAALYAEAAEQRKALREELEAEREACVRELAKQRTLVAAEKAQWAAEQEQIAQTFSVDDELVTVTNGAESMTVPLSVFESGGAGKDTCLWRNVQRSAHAAQTGQRRSLCAGVSWRYHGVVGVFARSARAASHRSGRPQLSTICRRGGSLLQHAVVVSRASRHDRSGAPL